MFNIGEIACDDCGRSMEYGTLVNNGLKEVCDECLGNYSWCDICDGFFSDDELAEEHLCYYCKDQQKKFKKMI